MRDLLPNTRDLLVLLLEGLDENTPDLPEVRMGKGGRSGHRFWHYGVRKKAFEGRRPAAEFEELRAEGLLRRLRVDSSTGTYFAFTPEAFRERDAMLQAAQGVNSVGADSSSPRRPDSPPPELLSARSRMAILDELRTEAKSTLAGLLGVSVVENRFEPDSGVISFQPWKWGSLAPENRPLQGNARKAVERWLETAGATLDAAGPEHRKEFDRLSTTIRRIYIRGSGDKGPVSSSVAANLEEAEKAVDGQFALVEQLPGAHEPARLILVPDTNALLQDPDIEHWEVGSAPCEFAIVSQVQAELDGHKNGERKVADKAAKLIRKFKEYGRRGNTLEGVPLVGQRQFREIPISPNMAASPSWLNPADADDRILASALEIASKSPSATVLLVTRDRGLQNKARATELPAVDVDDL